MRLEGSLDAFSLPDIFQLLSFTKKTGALHLRRDDLHGVVYVTTGSLTGGSSNVGRQALARRLIGAGAVDDDALRAAVDAALDGTDLAVTRALQQSGGVDEGTLHEVATEHVIDTVFDLLRWPDGDFEFVVEEVNPDDVGVTVTVEQAVEESRRRLDGWERVSTTIPSPDAVLAVAPSPVEDPLLSRDEWTLLALVDGRRSVADVVTTTGRGEFFVVSTLASLVDRGLLVVTHDDEPPAAQVLLRRVAVLAAVETAAGDAPAAPRVEATAQPSLHPAVDEREAVTSVAEAFALAAPAQREPDLDVEPGRALESVETVDAFAGEVVPPRAEPTRARRRPDHPDDDLATAGALVRNQIEGTAAIADPAPELAAHRDNDVNGSGSVIERDPSVNKSLLLRLIAGVRGL